MRRKIFLELHPVQWWPLDGMEALWVALSRATAWKSCVLLRCCAWPCVGRALMPGGYGFDASGSILVQCVPQDGSKSPYAVCGAQGLQHKR